MFKKLFKQTFIYGVATVLPRMLNFLLVPLYTKMLPTGTYGEISLIFAYFVLFNVVLSYGMETAFFRFFHKKENKDQVISTSSWSLLGSSVLFLFLGYLFQDQVIKLVDVSRQVLHLVLWILFFDAVVVIPFAWLRARERPIRYAVIKVVNVAVTIGLNIFFLIYLKDWSTQYDFLASLYIPHYEIEYVFIANLVASLLTLLMMISFYFKVRFVFNKILWKKMMRYAFPVLIAGVAFAVNEAFDRIMMSYLLPKEVAKSQIGMYAACYKLALFMTLFSTAFRLGIEPFFFSQAEDKNARQIYAEITKYFTIFGSFILIVVMVFIDLLKRLIILDEAYWEAMNIVPLILLGNLFMGIYYNLSVWYKVTDRTKFGGYISLAAAGVTIGVNLLLIPTIGYIGAAISTLAAYGVMMIMSFFWGQKYYPIPYNLKKIVGYIILSAGFSAISFYGFRNNYTVGISLLLIFLAVIYLGEKNELRKIIKE